MEGFLFRGIFVLPQTINISLSFIYLLFSLIPINSLILSYFLHISLFSISLSHLFLSSQHILLTLNIFLNIIKYICQNSLTIFVYLIPIPITGMKKTRILSER
jgi:hypothetical protein